MFGYIRPHVPELKVAEYEKYRAAYCGLCRSIGHVTGQLSRLTLSYDLVFLAAVRMVLEGITPEFESMRCIAHPTSRRLVMKDNPALSYAAKISALLADEKNRDDIEDEHGAGRIKSLAVKPLLSDFSRRAEKKLHPDENGGDECRKKIRELLCELSRLEENNCTSANETCAAFGEVLRYVFAFGLEGENALSAGKIGYHTGRFIYMCDAADDMTEDIRKHRYNPLALGWGEYAMSDGKISPMVKDAVMTSAPIELEALADEVERLDKTHIMTPIIKNTVYLGLPCAIERALSGEKGKIR
ncbi:MAG: DUF5685 family protein [Eubacteriales bacterium]